MLKRTDFKSIQLRKFTFSFFCFVQWLGTSILGPFKLLMIFMVIQNGAFSIINIDELLYEYFLVLKEESVIISCSKSNSNCIISDDKKTKSKFSKLNKKQIIVVKEIRSKQSTMLPTIILLILISLEVLIFLFANTSRGNVIVNMKKK